MALVEEIESQGVATTAGVQQREDYRDDVYNVYSNRKNTRGVTLVEEK